MAKNIDGYFFLYDGISSTACILCPRYVLCSNMYAGAFIQRSLWFIPLNWPCIFWPILHWTWHVIYSQQARNLIPLRFPSIPWRCSWKYHPKVPKYHRTISRRETIICFSSICDAVRTHDLVLASMFSIKHVVCFGVL